MISNWFFLASIHSKADPLGHNTGRTMAHSAFDAAIEEYNDCEGVFSDSGDNEQQQDAYLLTIHS